VITFTFLEFRNFQSYGNAWTSFKFDNLGTNLINGENGSGKSSIISALVYACYGKSTEGLKDNELINNINNKNMEVIAVFEKDGMFYKIHRSRKCKNGDTLRLWENTVNNFPSSESFDDEYEKTLDSSKNTNLRILNTINISYELFIRIVVFSANSKPFFELTPRSGAANQSDIIEELFEIKELAVSADALKDITKETDTALTVELSKSEMVAKEIERYKGQIVSITTRIDKWSVDNEASIVKLKSALEKVKDVSLDEQKEHHVERDKLLNQINDLEHTTKNVNKIVRDELSSKLKLISELEHLHKAECPYCLQKFDSKEKIKNCDDFIEVHDAIISKNEKTIDVIAEQIAGLSVNLDLINDCITVDNLEELLKIKNQQQVISEKIKELGSSDNPHKETLEDLEDNPIKSYDMKTINDLTTRKEHQKFLYKLLTDKNSFIRKTLLNKHLPYLNSRLYFYLDAMNLPHTVEFGHDLSAKITKYGKTLNFKSLSTGQRSRVNLALSFAFRDILQKIHGIINICILDEVLDQGLDGEGVELAAKLLKRKAIDEDVSVYVITHRNELDNTFDNVITVKLINNFSEIG